MSRDFAVFKTVIPEHALREAANRDYPVLESGNRLRECPRTVEWRCPWGVILNALGSTTRYGDHWTSPGSLVVRDALKTLGYTMPPASHFPINLFMKLWDSGKIPDLYDAFGLAR